MATPLATAPDTEELLDRLLRTFPQLAPAWRGMERDGSFVRALLEISARLGRETTRRFERLPERDALAFFDLLELPPATVAAAQAITVMSVVDGRTRPVLMDRGAELSAAGPDGDVAFETISSAALTPSRLSTLATVDPVTDRIEPVPASVSALEPGPAPLDRRLVAFADVGSESIQLDPAVGLIEGDLLRIGAAAYRVASADAATGLVTLADPLEASAAAATVVSDIRSLEAFDLRNVQRHVFAVGHDDLLNLDQPALITVGLEPADLKSDLGELDVTYDVWATRDGEDEPRWHELQILGSAGSDLVLLKSWSGPIDKTEVGGQKFRWVRATAAGPLAARFTTTRANRLTLRVETYETGNPSAEGSDTVELAFHNATPLSPSSRFLPFGAEPQRFDTFSVAAPEVLSKQGATATFDVTLVDGSLNAVAGPVDNQINRSLYGIGTNGDLQRLDLDADSNIEQWTALGPVTDAQGETTPLAAATGLAATSIHIPLSAFSINYILAFDVQGRLWMAFDLFGRNPSVSWTMMPELPAGAPTPRIVVIRDGLTLYLVADIDGRLMATTAYSTDQGWSDVKATGTVGNPASYLTLEAIVDSVEGDPNLVSAVLPGDEDIDDEDPEARLFIGTFTSVAGNHTVSWTDPEQPVDPLISPQAVKVDGGHGRAGLGQPKRYGVDRPDRPRRIDVPVSRTRRRGAGARIVSRGQRIRCRPFHRCRPPGRPGAGLRS